MVHLVCYGADMTLPYTMTPRWAKITEQILLPTAYLGLVASSVVVLRVTRFWEMTSMAYPLIFFAFVAAIGAATRFFQVELVALWFVAMCLAIGSINIVDLGFTYTGAFIGALVPWVGLRILRLSIVARRARATVD